MNIEIDVERIKAHYKENVQNLINSNEITTNDEEGYISLFHGTSVFHLSEILEKGILCRNKTKNSNWAVNKSIEELTYLSNKWHYFYAINSFIQLHRKYPEEQIAKFLPCYIEVRVPKNKLLIDEDFFASKYVKNRIKCSLRKKKALNLHWSECLNEYGTVSHLGDISPDNIISFTILGDMNIIDKYFGENSLYYKDYEKWQQGKSKGKLRLNDLLQIETESNFNMSFWLKNIPKDRKVAGVIFDKDRLRLLTQKID